jgi:hypothetical protein
MGHSTPQVAFRGNRTRTARFVGLSLRSLQYKLKRYDAERERTQSRDGDSSVRDGTVTP